MNDPITLQLELELASMRAQLEEMDIFKDIQALERIVRRRKEAMQNASTTVRKVAIPANSERHISSGRQESSTSIAMKNAAEQFLDGKTNPIQTIDIFEALEAQGIKIPGTNAQNNLSAHLSRDSRFHSRGREGWLLSKYVASEPEKVRAFAGQYIVGLSRDSIKLLSKSVEHSDEIPTDVDRDILQNARAFMGRNLLEDEKIMLRNTIRDDVRAMGNCDD